MKMDMSQVAKLEDIQKYFGSVVAIDQLSFALNKGECLALVGHNGAGKSTLIKIILGLTKPSHGNISIMGCDPGNCCNPAPKVALVGGTSGERCLPGGGGSPCRRKDSSALAENAPRLSVCGCSV